jgi:hypothetical protein
MSKIAVIPILIFIFSTLSHAAEADTFRNPCAGISITKPAEWYYMGIDQNYENLKKSKMKDEERKKMSLKIAYVPMLIITKYKEPYNNLNPTLKVDAMPAGDFKGTDPIKMLSGLISSMNDIFNGYKIIKGPLNVKVDGLSGAYVRFNTIMELETGQAYPSTSEVWLIPRGEHIFMFSANTRQDESNCTREEVRKIIDTIKIDR